MRVPCAAMGVHPARLSDLEPQPELNLAAVPGSSGPGNDPCRRADVSAREDNEIGCIKVRVIQNVEDLRPELQIQSLFQGNPFEQRSIHVEHARSAELTAPCVTEGSSQRHQEGIGIEIAAGFRELLHTQNGLSL